MCAPVAPRAHEVIADLVARGRYHFTSAELRSALGVSDDAARQALSRLAAKGSIASPARGFYVIVPPEYRRLGCLPAGQFIPALMEHRKVPYYAAFAVGCAIPRCRASSSAGVPGHPRQKTDRRSHAVPSGCLSLHAGTSRTWLSRRSIRREEPFLVSTVEATAVDLVGYMHLAGGVNRVAGLLSELGEETEPGRLVEAARSASIPWAQRLGYLLDYVGAEDKAVLLREYVRERARNFAKLLPGRECGGRAAIHGLAVVRQRGHRAGSVIARD